MQPAMPWPPPGPPEFVQFHTSLPIIDGTAGTNPGGMEAPVAVEVVSFTRPTHAPVPRVHAADTQPALVCKAQAVWLGDADEEGHSDYCGGAPVTVAYPVQAKSEVWKASDGATHTPHRGPCRCKTSRCLKLYCACFAARQLCSAGLCRCDACFNDGRNPER